MKYIISRYNHDISWIPEYTDDYVLYDRSQEPTPGSIVVPNIGSDIYDKLTYIIENYENLPEIAVYTKANIFKYITKEEFDKIKDNKNFTPILSFKHKVRFPICYYMNGLYHEINNYWYLKSHPAKRKKELVDFLGIKYKLYLAFAPGSNYIVPRENILKHSKDFYIKLRSFLDWTVYPGEAQIIERSLYYIWS
jgi:hypothetical protein